MITPLRERIHQRARASVHKAIELRQLTRKEVCEECGNEGYTYAHHSNYCKFLDVYWLCGKCHHKHHPHGIDEGLMPFTRPKNRLQRLNFDTQADIDKDRNQSFGQFEDQLTISPTIFGRLHNYA